METLTVKIYHNLRLLSTTNRIFIKPASIDNIVVIGGGLLVYNLKKLRKEKGISQQKLADIISVSQQSINKYENHNIEPDITTLTKLANYFQTSVDYLIGYDSKSDEEIFNTEEQKLVNAYRKLTPKERKSIILVMENYLTLHNEK